MTQLTLGRWLLVALAVVALAVAMPVVSAHGNETTPVDQHPNDGDADTWATWMDAHMNEQMGPGAVEWMESHMGVTMDEMARTMADGGHSPDDGHRHGTNGRNPGMDGNGRGC